ncbi:MAG: hypothetical protein BWK73_35105 [Thiothrix lacustris]|uniref:Uncharacterized protein n=1 Tax=Thiothrix lacustris TaxID=525917 RepID=A0A1Y1QG76_9GAMM|nr:MAG: hypothetical protein BWK73_35105 [Thiothrix lacustris]
MNAVLVPVNLLNSILNSVYAVEGELGIEHSESLSNIEAGILSLIPDKEDKPNFADQVAMAAVAGLMAHPNHEGMTPQFVARHAYAMADALIKEREKRPAIK